MQDFTGTQSGLCAQPTASLSAVFRYFRSEPSFPLKTTEKKPPPENIHHHYALSGVKDARPKDIPT
ncbi:MAG: hypothetical protein L0956_10695, partial [Candidatus Mariimomonas ferrooxydans]